MNIINKVKVNICGKDYNLQTDETPEYITALAARVDKEINSLAKSKPNFGIQNAAVFVALTSLDEAHKAEDGMQNIRKQINTSVNEAAKARAAKEKLEVKVKDLEAKIKELEKEIKELKKRPLAYDCEQLVLDNTIVPSVTIYAEEKAAPADDKQDECKQPCEAPEDETVKDDKKESDADPDQISFDEPKAENASTGSEKSEDQGEAASECVSGGSAEAADDDNNTQNADLTGGKKRKKKR